MKYIYNLLLLLITSTSYSQTTTVDFTTTLNTEIERTESLTLPLKEITIKNKQERKTFIFGLSWLYPYQSMDSSIDNLENNLPIELIKINSNEYQLSVNGEKCPIKPIDNFEYVIKYKNNALNFPIRLSINYYNDQITIQKLYKYETIVDDKKISLIPFLENWYIFNNQKFIGFMDEPLKINSKVYKLVNINIINSKITFKEVNSKRTDGIRIGQYIDIKNITKELSSKNRTNNKNTILHFWAEWCGPCKQQIPELAKIEAKIDSNNYSMYHVLSYFDSDDLNKAKNYIKNKLVPFKNSFYKHNTSILKTLKINTFPTYIVIDQEGKIIYRGSNLLELKNNLDNQYQ